jgi:hypothetical protein
MTTLPDLQMDVTGRYNGGAYWNAAEYRVLAREADDTGTYAVVVEDTSGSIVGEQVLSAEQSRDLIDVASRDHSLSGFDDDWDLPAGIERRIEWVLQTNMDHEIVLTSDQIDEVAMWLRFATGEEVWDGGDEWEF